MSAASMDELEFDFFEEETRGTTPAAHPRPAGVPPPEQRRFLLRLAALVGLVILVIALPIGLTQGSSDPRAVDGSYLANLSPIAADSQQLGQSFARLLSASRRASRADLAAGLSSLVEHQQAQVLRAQAIVPPPRLRSEHTNALLALEFRLSGLQGLRDTLPQAVSGSAGIKTASTLAAQAARLLTGDLVWDDLFRRPATAQLAREGVRDLSVPSSHFLANPDLATPSGMELLLQQLRGATARSPVQGPMLKLGDRGPAVARWQAQLNSWLRARRSNQKPLPLDGVFGSATQAATKALQRSRGLTPDGIVGGQTRRGLQAALKGGTH